MGYAVLYADDAGIVSHSPGGLGNMMEVIVKLCTAFGLILSEAKTEIIVGIMDLHGKMTR